MLADRKPGSDACERYPPWLNEKTKVQMLPKQSAAFPQTMRLPALTLGLVPAAALTASVQFLGPSRRIMSRGLSWRWRDLAAVTLLVPHLLAVAVLRGLEFLILLPSETVRYDGRFLLVVRNPQQSKAVTAAFVVKLLLGTALIAIILSSIVDLIGLSVSTRAGLIIGAVVVGPFLLRSSPGTGKKALEDFAAHGGTWLFGDFARAPWSTAAPTGTLRGLLVDAKRGGVSIAGLARPVLWVKVYRPAGFSAARDAHFSVIDRIVRPVMLIHSS